MAKPCTVTFLKRLLISALLHQARFSWTVTSDNHLPLCPDYMVDAIASPIHALVSFDELSTRCVIWFCPVVAQHPSCRPILDADIQSPATSDPIYCNRWCKNTSDNKEAAYIGWFLFPHTTQRANISWPSIPAWPLIEKNNRPSITTVFAWYCVLLFSSHQFVHELVVIASRNQSFVGNSEG